MSVYTQKSRISSIGRFSCKINRYNNRDSRSLVKEKKSSYFFFKKEVFVWRWRQDLTEIFFFLQKLGLFCCNVGLYMVSMSCCLKAKEGCRGLIKAAALRQGQDLRDGRDLVGKTQLLFLYSVSQLEIRALRIRTLSIMRIGITRIRHIG